MEKISFDKFYGDFSVRRNPVKDVSPYENTLLDLDEEELDIVDETDYKKIWTLVNSDEGFKLVPGPEYRDVIGFFVCNKEWKPGQQDYLLE